MATSTFPNRLNSSQPWIPEKRCSIDLIPKNMKNSDFSYSKPLREYRTPKFKIRDRVRITNYDLHFRKSYKAQLTKEVFEVVAISSRKPATYTIKDEQAENIRGNFYQKELMKIISQGKRLQNSRFQMHLCNHFQTLHWDLLQTFYQNNWILKVNGRLKIRKYPTHQCTKLSRREE